ncbi:Beta-2-microglobulin, partial [Ophiophagus hannah]
MEVCWNADREKQPAMKEKVPDRAPTVQVYSRHPVSIGKENTLHCFVEGFHPPKINVTLLKNNVGIPGVQQSDLSFKEDWTFQLLTHVSVVPDGKAEYSCKVEHQTLSEPKIMKWGNYFDLTFSSISPPAPSPPSST